MNKMTLPPKLIIVFGKPGAGKDTAMQILTKNYGYYPFIMDSEHRTEYKEILAKGENPPESMRIEIVNHILKRISELQIKHERLLINWAFFKDSYRKKILEKYPHARFVLIDTDVKTIKKRLTEKPRVGHVNPHIDLSLSFGDSFENPQIAHAFISNNGSVEDLENGLNMYVEMQCEVKRIMIIGNSGSGKSTLAIKLAKSTGIPLYHLDQLFWLPGWKRRSKNEWKEILESLVQKDSWIIDGNHNSTLEIRFQKADTIIFLDVPKWKCLLNVVKRKIVYFRKQRPDIMEGEKEKLSWELISWIIRYPRDSNLRSVKELSKAKNVFILKSHKEIELWLKKSNQTQN